MTKEEYDQEMQRCEAANLKYQKSRNKKINKVLLWATLFKAFHRKYFKDNIIKY